MRSIKTIQDVVDWGLCVGCGACYYICDKAAVSLVNVNSIGIRPKFKGDVCQNCVKCLSICPGFFVEAGLGAETILNDSMDNVLIGSTLEIWEGYASDQKLRFRASSGGILSALALYCLERENMEFVLHTGTDLNKPLSNITVQSRTRNDLLARTGSRYSPSSPCDSLIYIEKSEKPCVFIGKPCDVAAVSQLRKKRPELNANLGLVLSFFCAGTPTTGATLDLLSKLGIDHDRVNEVRYRGDGWPGNFVVSYNQGKNEELLTYKESWHFLQKFRSFRCHLCPDGLGESADISCGDAWHRYSEQKDIGRSLVLVRSDRGKEILHRAMDAGYLTLTVSGLSEVFAAQGLPQRKREVFGRLLAMRALCVPVPRFKNFSLIKAWWQNSLSIKIRTVLGTLRRIIQRRLWHQNRLSFD